MVPYRYNPTRDSSAPSYLFKHCITCLSPTHVCPSFRHGTNPRPTSFLPRPPSSCFVPLLSLVRPSLPHLSILTPLLPNSITLHLGYHPSEPGNPPIHYSAWHAWSGFAVVMSTNLVALLVIIVRRDIVWCVAATWLCISLWLETPKPAPVYVRSLFRPEETYLKPMLDPDNNIHGTAPARAGPLPPVRAVLWKTTDTWWGRTWTCYPSW
jgi:hypothetical protein